MVGLVIASGAAHVFRLFAWSLPRIDEIRTDWRVTLFALATALAVTIMGGRWLARRVTGDAVIPPTNPPRMAIDDARTRVLLLHPHTDCDTLAPAIRMRKAVWTLLDRRT
jgi:hypothetical protein